MPDGLERIEENAFANCAALETIVFENENKLKYIGQNAFQNVPWYDDTIYNDASSAEVIYIGNIAYAVKDQMDSNSEIVLREGTVSVTPYAFALQSGLISLQLPSSIKTIAQFAFGNHMQDGERLINTIFIDEAATLMENIAGIFTVASKIVLNVSPVQLKGSCAYSYDSVDAHGVPVTVTGVMDIIDLLLLHKNNGTLPDIYVPRALLSEYLVADVWSYISDNIKPYDGIYEDYIVAEQDGGYEIIYYKGAATEIVIPSELNEKPVTAIRSYAFNTAITQVSGGVNLKYLLDFAFAKCVSLSSVTLPDGLLGIGNSAFENCSALTSIAVPASVKSIGNSAFINCVALENVTLSAGLLSVGDYAFAYCARIVNITIPFSVTQMGNNIFNDCMSLEIMIMKGSTPPRLGSEGLYRSTLKVYVSDEALLIYKAADNWNKYDDRTFALSQMSDVLISQREYEVGENVAMTDAVGDGITVYIAASGISTFEQLQIDAVSMLVGDFNNLVITMPSIAGSFRVYVVINNAIISVGTHVITVQEA
ncbi:MAG: leucine-rich repeat protein [Clostridia bacterium]|nr:leucine-rich repeat protein [Clostridia bacterium]